MLWVIRDAEDKEALGIGEDFLFSLTVSAMHIMLIKIQRVVRHYYLSLTMCDVCCILSKSKVRAKWFLVITHLY